MKEGAAELAFTVDEGAGRGLEIKDLKAAVSVLNNFSVTRGDAFVIDHNVVVLITSDDDVFLEGNHHFLSVFKNESEFGHGGVFCVEPVQESR